MMNICDVFNIVPMERDGDIHDDGARMKTKSTKVSKEKEYKEKGFRVK